MDGSGRLWPRAELRVGDADRQGVVAELQRHFVDGRLTSDELDERVAQALAARTFGDLAVPLADLPVLPRSAQIEPHTDEPHDDWSGFVAGPPLGALMVVIGLIALSSMFLFPAMRFGVLPFWPIIMLGFFFIGGRPRRSGRRSRWHRGDPPTRYL
jgi:Domain of unknown function (DUF1707)